jgi:hypothetical protein
VNISFCNNSCSSGTDCSKKKRALSPEPAILTTAKLYEFKVVSTEGKKVGGAEHEAIKNGVSPRRARRQP